MVVTHSKILCDSFDCEFQKNSQFTIIRIWQSKLDLGILHFQIVRNWWEWMDPCWWLQSRLCLDLNFLFCMPLEILEVPTLWTQLLFCKVKVPYSHLLISSSVSEHLQHGKGVIRYVSCGSFDSLNSFLNILTVFLPDFYFDKMEGCLSHNGSQNSL